MVLVKHKLAAAGRGNALSIPAFGADEHTGAQAVLPRTVDCEAQKYLEAVS